MPKQFKFYENQNDDNPRFTCKLKSQQCSAKKQDGSQCKNKVVLGLPKCYHHLAKDHNLRIATSTIPNSGKGLYASKTVKIKEEVIRSAEHLLFKKGEKIIEYVGDEINEQENARRYGTEKTAPYSLEVQNDKIIDGACKRGTASFINHKRSNQTNVRFSRGRDGKAYLVADKNIYDGMEIFVNYGREYSLNDGSRHTTK